VETGLFTLDEGNFIKQMKHSNPLQHLQILAAALFLTAGLSQAQLLLSVDFSAGGTAPGTPTTQAGYDYFNVGVGAITADLSRTYTGLSTDLSSGSVTLTVGKGDRANYTARDRDTMTGSGTFSYYNLYRAWANPGTLSLSGLDANMEYRIVLYAYDYTTSGSTKLIDRTSGTSGATTSVTWTSGYSFNASTPSDIFSSSFTVTSNASGLLNFWVSTASGTTPSGAQISGLQIYAVPEPSVAALGVFALIGMAVVSRKRKTDC
jgi:hypothetical protein